MSAGPLREVLAYQTRQKIDDEAGNPVSGDWLEQARFPARVTPLKGGETVLASRLTGIQPFLILIRYSRSAALVTTDGRLRDTRSGATYAITTAVPDEKRAWISITATTGVAE